MEEVIEGGPWLHLGQPIVLQKWEPGMVLRKLKHTEVPVWIKLRHLPVELWTTEGLSTLASGIGRPLYPDAITRACTRLDFARVCVMLNVSSKLPKHVVIMMPNELGGESACKVDVEKSMPIIPAEPELKLKKKVQADPVRKKSTLSLRLTELARTCRGMTGIRVRILSFLTLLIYCVKLMMKQTARQGVLTNAAPQRFPHVEYSDMECSGLNRRDHQVAVRDLVNEFRLHFIALLETRVLQNNVTRIQSGLLSRWRWFVDYGGPGYRIWIAWNDELIDVDILNVDSQFVHCRVHIYELHETLDYGGLWSVCSALTTTLHYHLDSSHLFILFGGTLLGTPMYSVTRKLKALKPVFRQQRRCKGDLAMNVKLAAGFLEVAQNILQLDRHNSLLLLLEHCCRIVYLKASKLEQVMLRQRAKLQWLKGGDQCSRIFFRRVATRRSNKRVFQISDNDGNEQTEPTVISSIFGKFFQDLLGGTRLLGLLTFGRQSPWARWILIGFFKAAWPVVGGEVSIAIMDFFKTGHLLKQVNATLLTLIPKVRTPHSAAEFRPISCCNVIYKVITKILVSRIRESLDLLISPSQNAFVPGRLISDNVLLAQELFAGIINVGSLLDVP
ncbi:hypothetical protein Sango_2979400 [Sesamum angolense]|uniref:Reverse transcriptase domain-containing protein n=1 Tax=Sesamum angolense TaxID=2727404 RepID=A0AAE1T4Z7_9LAMI|nr:hypothetical protein Sango_2979400 [Sesamum angolense]